VLAITARADESPRGDPKRGALVAGTCQACHGMHGEGMAVTGYPRLAGQTTQYLDKQLNDYASGRRDNPIMTPLAKSYGAQQQLDVAAYYSSLHAPDPTAAATYEPALLARGRLLARMGDEAKQLQACANCHGPDGSGEPFAAPYLAGQRSKYLTNAINEWRAGTRRNDAGQQMSVVAHRLDDKDIAAVSAYFEFLGSVAPAH